MPVISKKPNIEEWEIRIKGWKESIGYQIGCQIFPRLPSLLLFGFWSLSLTIYHLKPAQAEQEIKEFDYWSSLCSAWEEAVKDKKYEDALKACDTALSLNSHQPNLWLARGNILLKFNKFLEAAASYDKVISLEPKNAEGWTQKCLALSDLAQYPQAIANCEMALRIDANWGRATPATAFNYRGVALSQLGKFPEALSSFDQATQLNPDYSLAWTNRCLAIYQTGDFSTALKSCDHALQVNQFWGNATASIGWANRARVSQAMKLYDEALNAYDRALATNKDDADIWTDYGILLSNLGKYRQAVSAFDSALKIRPESSLALVNQCANFNHLGQYQEALVACEAALQKGDNNWGKVGIALGWNHYGNALTGSGKYEEALAAFNRAIATQADFASAWSNRSVTLWYQGKFTEALVSSQRAIELEPSSSQAWYNQGRILTSLGQLEEAIAAYDRALSGDGYVGDKLILAQVWVNKSAVLLRLQRYSEAIASADSAIGVNPHSSAAWYNKALGLMGEKKYNEAINVYDRGINIEPKNANLWAGKGIALKILARYPEALAAFEKALDIDHNHPQALVNRNIINQMLGKPEIPPTQP